MAQDQRVEFLFAAQVTGQNQMQQLIASVDALRKETDNLKTANAGLASSTDAVVRNGVRYNNALDAQSKALRQTRQGTQQLGMQINDFATSVSTGASPLQAFNQQIGQVGFAMSQMGGIAGKVGGFLAGPWGAALTIATAVLVPLVMNLFQFGDAAEAAKKKADDLRKVEKDFADSTLKLMASRLALQGPIEENVAGYRRLYLGAIEAANGELQSARATVAAAQARMKAAAAEADTIKRMKSGSREGKQGIAKSGLAGLIGSAVGVGLDLFGYGKGEDAARSEVTAAQTAANIAEAGVNSAKKILQDFEKDASTGFSKSGGSSAGGSASSAAKRIAKSSPQAQAAFSLRGFYEEFFAKEFEENDRSLAKAAEEQIKSLVDSVPDLAKVSAEMDGILARNEEINQSFENIGNAVANSFKGMVTGAMSFKDAMKGIISAVIDELFRLFVVQQIVGMVSGALGGATGTPSRGFGSGTTAALTGRAVGGSVMGNTPYMVGERGPELFVPGGNGTIIPNQNVRGGGGGSPISISVDARGSNDPAAVRAQVQQGILEAAPAIIAAAEARTVAGLRRPRLGGAMQ